MSVAERFAVQVPVGELRGGLGRGLHHVVVPLLRQLAHFAEALIAVNKKCLEYGVKLAIEAAREGAKAVAIGARSADKLDDAEKRIAEVSKSCKVLKQVTDITDRAQCEALAAATIKAFGRIDALVNSAFFHGDMDYVSSANLDAWAAVLNTKAYTDAAVPRVTNRDGTAGGMRRVMTSRAACSSGQMLPSSCGVMPAISIVGPVKRTWSGAGPDRRARARRCRPPSRAAFSAWAFRSSRVTA